MAVVTASREPGGGAGVHQASPEQGRPGEAARGYGFLPRRAEAVGDAQGAARPLALLRRGRASRSRSSSLPVVAIFMHVAAGQAARTSSRTRSSPTRSSSASRRPLVAQALILLFGTPTAYLLATRRFPGRSLCVTLVELPIVLPPAVAGHRPARRVRPRRPARLDVRRARDRRLVQPDRGRARGHARRRAVLRPAGDRRVRGGRREPRRRVAHARRRARAHVLPGRAAARARRARRRRGALRSRAGSASSARRSCSPAASRARRRRCRSPSTPQFERRLRHRARDQRAARDRQPARSCSPSS